MTLNDLLAVGFTVVAGQIDRDGKNYGSVTPSGLLLTPEGEARYAELQVGAGTRGRPRAKRADAPAPADAPADVPADADDASLSDLLQG